MKTVKIKDYFGKIHYVPVNDEVYEALRDIRREEDRLRKRTAYHRSRFSLDEYETGMRTGESDPIQEELIRKEECIRLYEAISQLTPLRGKKSLRDLSFNPRQLPAPAAPSEGIKVM